MYGHIQDTCVRKSTTTPVLLFCLYVLSAIDFTLWRWSRCGCYYCTVVVVYACVKNSLFFFLDVSSTFPASSPFPAHWKRADVGSHITRTSNNRHSSWFYSGIRARLIYSRVWRSISYPESAIILIPTHSKQERSTTTIIEMFKVQVWWQNFEGSSGLTITTNYFQHCHVTGYVLHKTQDSYSMIVPRRTICWCLHIFLLADMRAAALLERSSEGGPNGRHKDTNPYRLAVVSSINRTRSKGSICTYSK